jgi:hypothetical protein
MANVWDLQGTQSPGTPSITPWPSGVGGGNGQSPYYNGGQYGQTQDWYNSPIGENIREENQNLAFGSWASRMGVANNDQSFNRWFYQQYPRFQQGYGQASMDNPLMTIDQFMKTLPNYEQLLAEYNAQSPSTRGVSYAQSAPNVRWINR